MISEDPGQGHSARQPGPAAAGRQGGPRHHAASIADLAFPAPAATRPRGPGLLTRRAGVGHYPCVTCHDRRHVPGTQEAGHEYQPPRRVGHHAEGVGADGRLVVHPGMAGQVLADFPELERKDGEWVRPEHDGLGQAQEWASRVLASDPQVQAVTIRQDVQEFDGQSWKAWRHVQSITRDTAAGAAEAGSTPRQAASQDSHHAAGPAAGPLGSSGTRRPPRPGDGRSPGAG